MVVSMAMAIVCLSVVVVTGYVGQLSLAQLALAGVGAWVSGRLAAVYDLPFLLVVAIAVAAAVPVGVLVALPALRTRGVELAVLTLGLSVMAYELVFSNGCTRRRLPRHPREAADRVRLLDRPHRASGPLCRWVCWSDSRPRRC